MSTDPQETSSIKEPVTVHRADDLFTDEELASFDTGMGASEESDNEAPPAESDAVVEFAEGSEESSEYADEDEEAPNEEPSQEADEEEEEEGDDDDAQLGKDAEPSEEGSEPTELKKVRGSDDGDSFKVKVDGVERTISRRLVEDKHGVKIDGKESTVSYDELVAGYQSAKASQERFKDAKEFRDEATEILTLFGQSPMAQLEHMYTAHFKDDNETARRTVATIAARYLDSYKAEVEAPEEERQRRRDSRIKDSRLHELERENKRLAEAQAARDEDQRTRREIENITAAMNDEGLPKEEGIFRRIAGVLHEAASLGDTTMTHARAARQVGEERRQAVKSLLSTASPERLAEDFPELAQAIRKKKVKSVRKKRSNRVRGTPPSQKPSSGKKPSNARQFWDQLDQEIR